MDVDRKYSRQIRAQPIVADIVSVDRILLGSLSFFFVGSILCGAAQNMSTMLVGRTFQGVGSGGILSLTEIVLSDLVSLSERGAFQGAFGAIWALASAIGPVIGGGEPTIFDIVTLS